MTKALPLLKAAYDRGVTSWDTANIYSNGISEKLIAKAIKKYEIPRHKLVIMTKCFATISEDEHSRFTFNQPKTKDYVNQGGMHNLSLFFD